MILKYNLRLLKNALHQMDFWFIKKKKMDKILKVKLK